jgi:hypothetical protein
MGIQGLFADDKLQFRFRQALVAAAKWMVTAIIIAWVIFCLAVSILTLLASIFPATDTVASEKNQPAYQSPIG